MELGLYFPTEVWFLIIQYLSANDVVNVSSTCKTWYTGVSHESIWQQVYTATLRGYPTKRFSVPFLVENAKRPGEIDFSSNNAATDLLDWKSSWNQRTVYIAHVMRIQHALVSSLTQRTNIFWQEDEPIHDAARILKIEKAVGAVFPIDLVVFCLHFAHQLLVDEAFDRGKSEPEDSDDEEYTEDEWNPNDPDVPYGCKALRLVSGPKFGNESKWIDMNKNFNYIFNVKADSRSAFNEISRYYYQHRSQSVSQSHLAFYKKMKMATFAEFLQTYEQWHLALTIMLSKCDNPPDDLPERLVTRYWEMDVSNMVNGTGKVFFFDR